MKKIVLAFSTLTISTLAISASVSCGCTTSSSIKKQDDNTNAAPSPDKMSVFSKAVARPQTIAELKKANAYYASLTDTATGETLFNQLRDIQMKNAGGIGSYSDLWETYKTAFVDKYDEKDGTILDIYEENPFGKDMYTYTPGTSQDKGTGSTEGQIYNREHLIPQSVFDATSRRAYKNISSRNDAHFVYPTDKVVNSRHGDLPYGKVVRNEMKISANGTKKGLNDNGEEVVEVIDAFKGDVARATFHFALTWRTIPDFNTSSKPFSPLLPTKMWPVFSAVYKNIYSAWSKLDPVSQWDVDRNEEIAKAQRGLRNPFTDMPKLIELIWM